MLPTRRAMGLPGSISGSELWVAKCPHQGDTNPNTGGKLAPRLPLGGTAGPKLPSEVSSRGAVVVLATWMDNTRHVGSWWMGLYRCSRRFGVRGTSAHAHAVQRGQDKLGRIPTPAPSVKYTNNKIARKQQPKHIHDMPDIGRIHTHKPPLYLSPKAFDRVGTASNGTASRPGRGARELKRRGCRSG